MPSYTFDITEKVISFAYEAIKDMPGNNGQEVLVERLPKDAFGNVAVIVTTKKVAVGRSQTIEIPVKIEAQGEIYWWSNHPDAIQVIIYEAEKHVDLITKQAEIAGPWDITTTIATGNWKIVGYDRGYEV